MSEWLCLLFKSLRCTQYISVNLLDDKSFEKMIWKTDLLWREKPTIEDEGIRGILEIPSSLTDLSFRLAPTIHEMRDSVVL